MKYYQKARSLQWAFCVLLPVNRVTNYKNDVTLARLYYTIFTAAKGNVIMAFLFTDLLTDSLKFGQNEKVNSSSFCQSYISFLLRGGGQGWTSLPPPPRL